MSGSSFIRKDGCESRFRYDACSDAGVLPLNYLTTYIVTHNDTKNNLKYFYKKC